MKQYNIIIRGSGEKHYNIVVRSEYHFSATLDEMPTYVYSLFHNSLILLSDPANLSLQKYIHADELVAMLREEEATPLKSSFVSSDPGTRVVLRELSPGILKVVAADPAMASKLILGQDQPGTMANVFPSPIQNTSALRQSIVTVSKGFHAEGSNTVALLEGSAVPLVTSYSGWSGAGVLRQTNASQHTEKYSAGKGNAVLRNPVPLAHAENFSGTSSTKFAMGQSSMTFSYGFNADGIDSLRLKESISFMEVTAVLKAESATGIKVGAADTESGKLLQAEHRSALREKSPDAVSGHPRHLYEMDDKQLSTFDTMTMDDVDFIR